MLWKVYNIETGKILKAGFDSEDDAKDWLEERADKLADEIDEWKEANEDEEEEAQEEEEEEDEYVDDDAEDDSDETSLDELYEDDDDDDI